MKEFRVSLIKSYIVDINAESEEDARKFVEFFTGDIADISHKSDRDKYKFYIENIECSINESFLVIGL